MPYSLCVFCGGEGCAACYASASHAVRSRSRRAEAAEWLSSQGIAPRDAVLVEIVMEAIQAGRVWERQAHPQKTEPQGEPESRFAFIEFREVI